MSTNDRGMFPDISEVPQMVSSMIQKLVWLISSYPLIVSKVLGDFLLSSKIVSNPDGSGRNFEDIKQPYFHWKILKDVQSIHRRIIQETFYNRNTLNRVCEKFLIFRHFYAIFAPSNSYFTGLLQLVLKYCRHRAECLLFSGHLLPVQQSSQICHIKRNRAETL